MPFVIFHVDDREPVRIEADEGDSVMRAAVTHGVPGIVGECGGQAMCGTCHVLVRDEYRSGLPAIGEDEEDMLDFVVARRDPDRSRLGCQLKLGEDLTELEVDVPATQY